MFVWITRRLEGRLYEWALAAPTLATGIHSIVWPGSFAASAFRRLLLVMSEDQLTALFIVSGTLRLFALAINGNSDVAGPLIRCACAAVGAFLWSQFAYALFLIGVEKGLPSPGEWYWVSFALAEIFVCYRAAMDVRRFVRPKFS